MTENINISIITAQRKNNKGLKLLFYHTCIVPRVSGWSLDFSSCLLSLISNRDRIMFVDTSDCESSNWRTRWCRSFTSVPQVHLLKLCDEFDSELNQSQSTFSGERDDVGFWTWYHGCVHQEPERRRWRLQFFCFFVFSDWLSCTRIPFYTLCSFLHNHCLYCRWVIISSSLACIQELFSLKYKPASWANKRTFSFFWTWLVSSIKPFMAQQRPFSHSTLLICTHWLIATVTP